MEFDKNIIGYDLKNKAFLKLEYVELSDSLDDLELNKLMEDKTKLYYALEREAGFEMTKGKVYEMQETVRNSANRRSYINVINDKGVIDKYDTSYFSIKEIGKHKYHLMKGIVKFADKIKFNEYGEFSVVLKD